MLSTRNKQPGQSIQVCISPKMQATKVWRDRLVQKFPTQSLSQTFLATTIIPQKFLELLYKNKGLDYKKI